MSSRIIASRLASRPSAVMLPMPPASATATASPGLDTEPIGACWTGARHPASVVSGVVRYAISLLYPRAPTPTLVVTWTVADWYWLGRQGNSVRRIPTARSRPAAAGRLAAHRLSAFQARALGRAERDRPALAGIPPNGHDPRLGRHLVR